MVCKLYIFYNKFLRYPESRIYSHTKSINLILLSENSNNKLTVCAVCVETVLVGTTYAIQFRNLK